MVITIALLGTIAAIAYGLRASKLGSDNTVAIQVNRKVIENILQAVVTADPTKNPNFATKGDPSSDVRGATAWHPLYIQPASKNWFALDDYGYKNYTSSDCLRFIRDTDNYELNVAMVPAVLNDTKSETKLDLTAVRYFYEIIVTTRWQDKSRWKWVETRAFSTSGSVK